MKNMREVGQRLTGAVYEALGKGGQDTTPKSAEKATESLEGLGVYAVNYQSDDEKIADWTEALWRSQDDRLAESERDWQQMIDYDAGRQFLAYNRELRAWVPRHPSSVEARSRYNVMQKAVSIRTTRLTANKPSVTLQATTTSRTDVERVHYRSTLFWYLWHKHRYHSKITRSRRWATKTGSGFLKVGWDPDAGEEMPATKYFLRFVEQPQPVIDPATGLPQLDPLTGVAITEMVQVPSGWEEMYLDRKGKELGPVHSLQEDPEREGVKKRVRNPAPDEAHTYREGDVSLGVRSPFNIRWDWHCDDPADSPWIQDRDRLPLSKIVEMIPNALEKLKEAKASTDESRVGETSTSAARPFDQYGNESAAEADRVVERVYEVCETWIFPKGRNHRERWGSKGALLITVGGVLVHKSRLPKWALKACPFIQILDRIQEGNHYGTAELRELLPVQDSINKSRFHAAEDEAVQSRVLLGISRGSRLSVQPLADLPITIVEHETMRAPKEINVGNGISAATRQHYRDNLEAAADLGNMHDASTGKLPSAGLAAQAIFALQYADEKSIQECSALQDEALGRLARATDAVVQCEFTDSRKIRVVGDDNEFLIEQEIKPEHLETEVDFVFSPGSMMSTTKEAMANAVIVLKKEGALGPEEAKRLLSAAAPDALRTSFDRQTAAARRVLEAIRKEPEKPPQPELYQDGAVFAAELADFMLSKAFDYEDENTKQILRDTWAYYAQTVQPTPMQDQGGEGGGGPQPAAPGGMQQPNPRADAARLQKEATAAMAPPRQ